MYTGVHKEGRKMNDTDRLEAILNYIQKNYRKKLDLKTLSNQFYLSPSYISKYIRENLNMGFSEYLSNIRFKHALDELETTDHSVTQIACDAGFPNLVTFNRAFRRRYGMAPTLYRKQLQSRFSGDEKKVPEMTCPVTADTARSQPYEKNWLKVMNLGAAENIQMEYIREHILLLKQELDFQYGRIDTLFCPENLLDFSIQARSNFSVLDDILDFLIANGITPFLNLGLKCRKIVRPDMAFVLNHERLSKIKHQNSYKKMLLEFIRHCIGRYGMQEVLKWRFELWWERVFSDTCISQEQLELLKIEYDCIKDCLPDACVGGMGFNIFDNNASLENFLERAHATERRLDFISVSMYPYNLEESAAENKLMPDEDFVENELLALRKLLAEYGYAPDALWVTEWNLSVSSRTWQNDICYKGAYMVRNLIASVGKTPCMAYWMCTDRTEEYFDSVDFLYGGGGMISSSGLRKAAFYALWFMKQLGGHLLAKGENYMITVSKSNGFYIVCHHMQCPAPDYYIQEDTGNPPEDISMYFPDSRRSFSFRLLGMTGRSCRLKKYCIRPSGGSLFEEWGRRGFHKTPALKEIDDLRAAAMPLIESSDIAIKRGDLQFETQLEANEIQLICIVQSEDSSGFTL